MEGNKQAGRQTASQYESGFEPGCFFGEDLSTDLSCDTAVAITLPATRFRACYFSIFCIYRVPKATLETGSCRLAPVCAQNSRSPAEGSCCRARAPAEGFMGDLYPVLLHAAVNDGPTLRALVGMHLPTYAAVTHVKVSSTVLDSVLDLAAVCGALRVPASPPSNIGFGYILHVSVCPRSKKGSDNSTCGLFLLLLFASRCGGSFRTACRFAVSLGHFCPRLRHQLRATPRTVPRTSRTPRGVLFLKQGLQPFSLDAGVTIGHAGSFAAGSLRHHHFTISTQAVRGMPSSTKPEYIATLTLNCLCFHQPFL